MVLLLGIDPTRIVSAQTCDSTTPILGLCKQNAPYTYTRANVFTWLDTIDTAGSVRLGTQTLSATDSIVLTGGSTHGITTIPVVGNAAPVNLTSDPQILAGTVDGQRIVLIGTSDVNTITLENGAGLLLDVPVVLNTTTFIEFSWDAGASLWRKITPAVTPKAYSLGNIGSSATINWANGELQHGTLTADTTLTFSNPVPGSTYLLVLTQDATGGWDVAFPTAIWVTDGVAKQPEQAASKTTIFQFVYEGTNYHAAAISHFIDTNTDEQTLQSAYNFGKVILFSGTGAANGLTFGVDGDADGNCDGTGGDQCWQLYIDGALGPQLTALPLGPVRIDAASGTDIIFRIGGVQGMALTSGGPLTFTNFGIQKISWPWIAGQVETDGTKCATQAPSTVNSGAILQDFGCEAFSVTGGRFYGFMPMRPSWNEGTGIFRLWIRTLTTNTTTWLADVALWCAGSTDAIPSDTNFDSATPQEVSITLAGTAVRQQFDDTPAITPGGSCATGDILWWRVRTKTGHTALATDAKVIGGAITFSYDALGEP